MKTKIVCSKSYAQSFRSELNETEFDLVWNNILQTGKQFYEIYKQRSPCILEIIPKYTGIRWDEFAPTEVLIYLVDTNGPSRSNPLTLKIRENIEYMLTVLAHELIHINMPNKLFHNKLVCEDVVNQVTLKVCAQAGISAGTETIEFYKKAMQNQGFKNVNINLEEVTVREALNLVYSL
ncbi:MAG: hypothetical protein WC852_04225 [Candidatus Nanoarchaeia archaeon]|jgi:hypothetical protein